MDLDLNKVHMYGQFVRAIIVKDTTIDMVSQGELCNYIRALVRVMEELQRCVPNPEGDESVNFLIDWIETRAMEEEKLLEELDRLDAHANE